MAKGTDEHYSNIQKIKGSLHYVTGRFPEELYSTLKIDITKVRDLSDINHFRKVIEECEGAVYYIRQEHGWRVTLAFEKQEDKCKFQLTFNEVQL